jgi:hypothetical protein
LDVLLIGAREENAGANVPYEDVLLKFSAEKRQLVSFKNLHKNS